MKRSESLDWLAFAIAVLSFVHFRFVGELYLSELALVLVFLFMLKKSGRRLLSPFPKRILFFGLLWFLSQALTDVVRAVPIDNLLRGWAGILFFLVDFSALYMLLDNNEKRLKIFIWGVVIGGLLKPFILPSEFFDVEPWKFGFGMPVSLLTILLISRASKKRLFLPVFGETILGLLGLVSIYLNARSLGAALILTAMLLFVARRRTVYGAVLKRLSLFKLMIISAVSLTMLLAILSAYKWVGEADLLPQSSQEKFESSQSSSFGLLGTLLSGRIEIFGSIHAVMDSPVLGHGSWAENSKYRDFLYGVPVLLGVDRSDESLAQYIEKDDLIPAHSHLMQAWVWAGVLGAVFWVMILGLILKALLQSLRIGGDLKMITVFVCVIAGWDLLFSPFGSWMRFTWGWELVLIVMACGKTRNRTNRRRVVVGG